ncbi:MAG: TonB-dependent receptor [Verrucomicrobia bacterium]|nr:MAG: TonB-dependent receptor [Verrucomicrobiota bacterium]
MSFQNSLSQYCIRGLVAAGIFSLSMQGAETVVLDEFPVTGETLLRGSSAVTQAQITLSKPVDIAEVLAGQTPSVGFVRKGPVAGDFVLRGLGRDNVQVAVDGCAMHGACPNRMDPPAFHVSAQQIERIVVRSGPFNVEHGGTVGGSVRIETRSIGDATAAGAAAYAGSWGYYSGMAHGGGRLGALRANGGISLQQGGVYRDGDGTRFTELAGTNFRPEYRETTAFRIFQLQGRATYEAGEAGEVTLAGGFNRSSDVLYPGLKMDTLRDESWRASAAWSRAIDGGLFSRITVEGHFSGVYHDMRDSFRLTATNPMFSGRGFMMRTLAWSRTAELRAIGEGTWSGGTLRAGLDHSERRWDADNLVMVQANDMLPDVLVRRTGAFVANTWEREGTSVETGVRLDLATAKARGDLAFTQAAHGTTTNRRRDGLTSAYVLAQRAIADGWRAYAGLGHGQRLPDPQERYFNLNRPMMRGDWVGNPDLDPVRATEVQAGIAGAAGTWTVKGSLFHSWLNDYVYLARLEPAPGSPANPANTRSYRNIDARLFGAELTATWMPAEAWRAEFGAAFQRGTRDRSLPGNTSDVLGEVPETKLRAALEWTPGEWRLRAAVAGAFDQDRVDPDLAEVPVDGWMTVDVLVSRQIGAAWLVTVGCENLFDETYRLHNAYLRDPFAAGVVVNEPGRFLYMRASWRY